MDNPGSGSPNEGDAFLRNGSGKKEAESGSGGLVGCCKSKHTSRCCIATSVFGVILVILGVVVLFVGKPALESKIKKSMALTPGSERTETWLHPPVQPHLTAYAFHITNPEAVLAGKKPVLEEKGPFVYKAITIRDSDNNMNWNEPEDLLTYRARKIYSFVPELSAEGYKDPDQIFVTVPNIPFWTGMNKIKPMTGIGRSIGLSVIQSNGGIQPFINVSVNGLLWGYPGSGLPCVELALPAECMKDGEKSPFSAPAAEEEDEWGDDSWGENEEEKSEKSADKVDAKQAEDKPVDIEVPDFVIPPDSEWEPLVKPKAEFINCQCEFGLFRDRNVTMREPVTFFTGTKNLTKKGYVLKYNGKSTLGWWTPGSTCDAVKGQDAGTLYPGIEKEHDLDIFIDLMCRSINLKFEQETEHAGIRTFRFIPPENALGSHEDPNPARNNPDNECYCMKKDGFTCYKSGVYDLGPCKRAKPVPLALSYPHFYQADPSFSEAVVGMNPDKEKHQFFIDVVPEFGFPLAIRPRFQLNLVLFKVPDIPQLSKLPDQIVMPFMWAEDGFGEPSDKMADAIRYGLSAPEKLPMLGAVVCFVLGGILLLVVLVYFVWRKRGTIASKDIS